MQHLLLLRHGEAHHGFPDELRELSDHGQREVVKSLSKAEDRIPRIEQIFHSGLVRAMQTAEIAAEQLAPRLNTQLQPQFLDGISPWGDPEGFCRQLTSEQSQAILVVTHNPFVEDLVEYLSGELLRIKTVTIVCLEVDFLERGCCDLAWIQH